MNAENRTGEGQYLTFKLADEIYGLQINKVREVLDLTKITRVPQAPVFMKGVINLRGGVVPVVDLRCKFGLPEAQITVDSCIIIVEVMMEEEYCLLGALADQVQAVLVLDDSQVVPAPKIGTRLDIEYIYGMGKREDDFIIILDIEKVFSLDQLTRISEDLKVSTVNQPISGEDQNLSRGLVTL